MRLRRQFFCLFDNVRFESLLKREVKVEETIKYFFLFVRNQASCKLEIFERKITPIGYFFLDIKFRFATHRSLERLRNALLQCLNPLHRAGNAAMTEEDECHRSLFCQGNDLSLAAGHFDN